MSAHLMFLFLSMNLAGGSEYNISEVPLRGLPHPPMVATGGTAVLLAILAVSLPLLFYGLSVLEKSILLSREVIRFLRGINFIARDGDDWLDEVQSELDLDDLTAQPWVDKMWHEENEGPGELYLDKSTLDPENRTASVAVNGLPDGPITIALTSQGRHSYRGIAKCRETGGEITDEHGVTLVRGRRNRLRLVINFGSPDIHNIDKMFIS